MRLPKKIITTRTMGLRKLAKIGNGSGRAGLVGLMGFQLGPKFLLDGQVKEPIFVEPKSGNGKCIISLSKEKNVTQNLLVCLCIYK